MGEIRGGKMMFEFVGSVIALILFVFSYIHLKRSVIMKRLHILMGWMGYMLGSQMRVAWICKGV